MAKWVTQLVMNIGMAVAGGRITKTVPFSVHLILGSGNQGVVSVLVIRNSACKMAKWVTQPVAKFMMAVAGGRTMKTVPSLARQPLVSGSQRVVFAIPTVS